MARGISKKQIARLMFSTTSKLVLIKFRVFLLHCEDDSRRVEGIFVKETVLASRSHVPIISCLQAAMGLSLCRWFRWAIKPTRDRVYHHHHKAISRSGINFVSLPAICCASKEQSKESEWIPIVNSLCAIFLMIDFFLHHYITFLFLYHCVKMLSICTFTQKFICCLNKYPFLYMNNSKNTFIYMYILSRMKCLFKEWVIILWRRGPLGLFSCQVRDG